MARVFFSSAIDGIPMKQIVNRYQEVERELRAKGHFLVNPASFYTQNHNEIKRGRGNDVLNAVIDYDLNAIRSADVLLADFSDPCRQYVGCICEIVYARLFKIPVIAYLGSNLISERPFFAYHCSVMTKKWDDAILAISDLCYRG